MTNPVSLAHSKVLDLLLDAICIVDREGRFLFVSAACERIFGYAPEEMVGRVMIDLVHPQDRERTLQAAGEIMAGSSKLHFENRYLRKDGQIVHIMWSARWSERDQVRIAVARDISERKRSESMRMASHAISQAAHAAEDMADLFAQIQRIIGQLLPFSAFSLVLADTQSGELRLAYQLGVHRLQTDACTLGARVMGRQPSDCAAASPTQGSQQEPGADGERLPWLGVPLAGRRGNLGALIVQGGDAEAHYEARDTELLEFIALPVAAAIEHWQMLEHLQFMAQYDPLTRLPNRALLQDRLHIALARARREQAQVALLFLDLDGFKQINDRHGHATGDLFLQEVAERLRHCVRESDTVARLGGDEFVVLLEDAQGPDHALTVAAKVRLQLNQPLQLDGHAHLPRPSIGVALYPQHGSEAQQLLQSADQAMYRAKYDGGNRFSMAIEPAALAADARP